MKLQSYDITSEAPLEIIPNAAMEFRVGQGLKLATNATAVCGATTVPTYICMKDSVATDLEELPVIRVHKGMVFCAPLTVAGAALKIGDKVTLAADCIGVTATTASGVFEITGFETAGKGIGDGVFGRFV